MASPILTDKDFDRNDVDFDDYEKKADRYLKRDTFSGTSLSGSAIRKAAEETYNKTGKLIPVEFILAQGQDETQLGKKLKSKNNFFNVGNFDDGRTRSFDTPEAGVKAYTNLLANDYLVDKEPEDLLKNFVNKNNNRYASDKQYEQKLKQNIDLIKGFTNAEEIQSSLIEKGYDPGPVDGIFGKKTEKALKEFQKDKGLKPDGLPGPKTKRSLLSMIDDAIVPSASADEVLTDNDFMTDSDMEQPKALTDDDFLTDADMEQPAQQAIKEQPKANNVMEIAKGGLRGLQGIAAGTGGLIDIAGQNIQREAEKLMFVSTDILPEEEKSKRFRSMMTIGKKVSEWGKTAKDFWTRASQEGIAAPDPETFKGEFMQNPSWTRGVSIVAEAVPSLGAAYVASAAAGGNPLVGLAFLGGIEGEQTFAEARTAGKSVDDANRFFGLSAMGTSVLEALPLTRFLKGGEGKVVKDAFIGAVQEGAEEGLQNLWKNVIAHIGYDETRNLTEGMVESIIGGAGSGGVIGGLTSGKPAKLDKQIKKAVDAGVPTVAIDAMQEAISNQIVSNADAVEQAIVTKPTAKFEDVSTDVAKKTGVSVNVTPEMEGAVDSGLPAIEIKPEEVKEVAAVLEKSNLSEERRADIIRRIEAPGPVVATKEANPTTDPVRKESPVIEPQITAQPEVQAPKEAETKPTATAEAKGEIQSPPDFKNTQDAISYGNKIKGNVQAIQALKDKEDSVNNDLDLMKNKKNTEQEQLDLAFKGQFIREALQVAEGKETEIQKKIINNIIKKENQSQSKEKQEQIKSKDTKPQDFKTAEEYTAGEQLINTKNPSEKVYFDKIGEYKGEQRAFISYIANIGGKLRQDTRYVPLDKFNAEYKRGSENKRKEIVREFKKELSKPEVFEQRTPEQIAKDVLDKSQKPLQKQEVNPIKATSKSVRDNTQSVSIENGKITVTSRSGSKKIGSYTFDLKKWEELDKSFGNPNFNKKEFIKRLNEEAIPGNYTEDRVGDPFVTRIEDAQISAINDAFKQYKAVQPPAHAKKEELKPEVKEQKAEEPVETEWEATKRKVAEMQARLEKEKADKKPLQSLAESAILKSEEVPNEDATGSRAVSEQPATGEPVGDRGRTLEPSRPNAQATGVDSALVAGTGEEGVNEVSPSDPIQNYRITDADELGVGGLKTKFKQNLSAIKLLKKIEVENRPATKEEQSVLVKYVGWGGMSQAFDRWNDQWGKEAEELKKLLTDKEYEAARASTINAHYTSPDIVKAMWNAVAGFGITRGSVLEPASGTGNFVGLAPQQGKRFSMVELDSLTGRIAKIVYPKANVQVKGFQEASVPVNYYDLAISNVPFSSYKPYDKKAKAQGIPAGLVLHDYFFAKALVAVKPGGIIAFVTSAGTLDKGDRSFREYLNKNAKFVGAIRLPSDAFKKNAMTEVVTDIIFLQKPMPGETFKNPDFINIADFKGVEVNQYFIDNPDKVIGKLGIGKGLYSGNEMTVKSQDDFAEKFAMAIDSLPKNIYKAEADRQVDTAGETVEDHTKIKANALIVKNGSVFQKVGDNLVKQDVKADDAKRIEGLIKIRDTVRDLLNAERTDAGNIEQLRKSLNLEYDTFVKKYSNINKDENIELMAEDPDYPLLASLEDVKKVGPRKFEYTKREIFRERINKPHQKPTKAGTVDEALKISLGEYGDINMDYISSLLNMSVPNVQKAMLDSGLVYRDPNGNKIVLKDEYLSGNVKRKMAEAEDASNVDPAFTKNVEALRLVIPKDRTFDKIRVNIGMPWIKNETYNNFLSSLGLSGKVILNTATGTWSVEKDASRYVYYRSGVEEYGVANLTGEKIFELIMNGKPVKITKTVRDESGEEKKVTDEEQTALAESKAEKIKEKFKTWFWTDDTRRAEYEKIYNENWNHTVPRQWDGTHLVFPGINEKGLPGKLRVPQLNAIWRGIINNRVMLAHSVGAGKTAIMTITAMESKRLGLANKSLIVAPKNTIPGWRSHINGLYPAAKVLIANEKNFNSKKLKAFLANVATGNWDIVVMSHDNYEAMPVSPDAYKEFVQEQIDSLREAKENAKQAGSRITVKNIETAIKDLEAKIESKLDQSKKLDLLYFEDLGIDALYVDEADLYKNLAYSTTKEKIKGMGTQAGSVRAMDMKMKTDILRKKNGKIVFATGTPISNSMVEAYTMMKYLQPETLREQGINSFDAWANTFADPTTENEVDVTGERFKLVTRFKNFMNMSSLRTMIGETWDIQTQQMLIQSGVFKRGVNLPNIKGGGPQNIVLPRSKDLVEYTKTLIDRAEEISKRKGKVKKGDDIMLTVMQDGIKAALDMRMIDPTLPADPNSKVEWTLNKLIDKYKEYADIKGTQIIFIDNPAPDAKAKFNPQEYMKKKLIASGIPEKEIAFIHDFEKDDEKAALYERMNSGEVRILFGSTEKLGAGTNIQNRLSVLYHLGIPQAMRPRDITQREGRIDRPGNMNKEIEIYRLAQKGSLDTFIYQLLEAKNNTVEQFMRGDSDMIDMDEQSADPYEAMKSLSSENPLVKEKSDVDRNVRSLRALYNAYIGERTKAASLVKIMPGRIDQGKKEAEAYRSFKSKMPEKPTKETFSVKIGAQEFTDKKEALDAIYKTLTDIPIKGDAPVEIGSYLGYKLFAEKNIIGDRVESTLSIKVSDSPAVFLRGKVSADPVGTFGSLDYGIFNDVDKYITLIDERVKEDTKTLNYARDVQSGQFSKQSELDAAVKRQKEIDVLLKKDMTKQTVSEVEKELGDITTDDDIKYANLGLAPQPKATKRVNDDIQGMVQFTDPDVESRFRLAKGMSVEGLKNKLKTFLADLGARMTRTYPNLPNKPEYAEVRNILSKQQINRSVANERAIRAIDAITAGFGPKKLDLFTRKVVLEDLAREIEAGRAIPFGYSEYSEDGGVVTNVEMFNKDKANIDYLVSKNPDVQEALRKRKLLWEALQSDLVTNGILDEEQVKQDYFRHQVLDYARLKATMGTGSKLRTPTPGYAKQRKGSTADINTDYVQAEFEVMAQAMHDIETSRNIKKIENSNLNIVADLRAQAKEQSEETGEKVDWHTLIPEGYTTWQPKEGNIFYMANSVSDKVLNAALENLDGIGIDPKDLKKVLALGTKRKEFVLPEEVATTLDNLYANKNINAIAEGAKKLTTYWKRWVLMNPRRAFKYNYQNFIGDFDAVVAGDPKILKKFGKAVTELNDTMLKGKPMTQEMREFFERGGLSAQMTVNELPELRNLEVFQRLLDSSPDADFKRQLNVWQRYWQGIGTLTTYREAIFRYAAYLHYRDMFTKGGNVNYGASIKSEINNISDPLDKAAKVATELLGDYANLTAFGKDMRESVIPFYSWLEINAKRYSRLTRNAFSEGWQKGIKTSATIAGVKGSLFLAKWMVRAAAMTGLIMLYNATMFPDEEEELNEYDKNRLHIILGRDENGNIKILRGQTAFADILEWFGLDAAPSYWREYTEGKASFADLFGTIPYTDIPAFGLSPFSGKIGLHPAAMKMVRGVNPLYKLPVETMTGKSLPVFDDRSWKVEDKTRNVVKALSLENEYDLVTGKPSRGYWNSVQEAFISKTDPEENAYRYIQGEKYKFLETVKGRGGSSDFYSPRSLLYREYRKALKLKDSGAITRIRKQMAEQGITQRDLQQSLERSDPLSGMNREDKAEFVNRYLTERDRKVMLPRANKYYVDTFRRSP